MASKRSIYRSAARFMDKIRRWDEQNGLLSSGHLNGEDIPEYSSRYGFGALLRALRAMDVPVVDVIWRQLFPETAGGANFWGPFFLALGPSSICGVGQ